MSTHAPDVLDDLDRRVRELEARHRARGAPPPPSAEARWSEFVQHLVERSSAGGRPTARQVAAFVDTWSRALRANPFVIYPTVTLGDNDVLILAWNPGPRVLEIEIDAAGAYAWSFVDNLAGTIDGSDDFEVRPPDRTFTYLALFSRGE